MSKVLITGGAGFIGSHTVDELVNRGYEVVVLDNLERQVHQGKMPAYLNDKAKFIRGDIRFRKHWLKALKGVEYIIHLAGAVGVGQSFWQAKKYADVNASGTSLMYEIITTERAIRIDVRKVIVASSKSIYGEGSYACEEHGVNYPLPRPVDQLKRDEWEVRCPKCKRLVKPVGITEDKPAQNLSPYALSKY